VVVLESYHPAVPEPGGRYERIYPVRYLCAAAPAPRVEFFPGELLLFESRDDGEASEGPQISWPIEPVRENALSGACDRMTR